MYLSKIVAALLFVCLIGADADAQNRYTIAPAPEWVTPLAADFDARPPRQASGGTYYLLLDDQVRVDRSDKVVYSRYVVKVLNREGVDEAGIWIAYLHMSKRVESTFVRRRVEPALVIG